jgi:hypothetical protein
MGRLVSLDRKDSRVAKASRISSICLWIPQLAALIYTCMINGNSYSVPGLILPVAVGLIGVTWAIGTKLRGDFLMLLCFFVGVGMQTFNFGCPTQDTCDIMPRQLWLAACICQGFFSGILCKIKDVQDGRHFEHYSIGERLYLVVPYALGECVAHVYIFGLWVGMKNVFTFILLSLATVGYLVMTHKVFAWSGVYTTDLIELLAKIFTTSFGAVFGVLVAVVGIVTYLAVPFVVNLLTLNALVSCWGIALEIIVYEVA